MYEDDNFAEIFEEKLFVKKRDCPIEINKENLLPGTDSLPCKPASKAKLGLHVDPSKGTPLAPRQTNTVHTWAGQMERTAVPASIRPSLNTKLGDSNKTEELEHKATEQNMEAIDELPNNLLNYNPQNEEKLNILREVTLNGIYQSDGMESVYKTRELISKASPIDYNDTDGISLILGEEHSQKRMEDYTALDNPCNKTINHAERDLSTPAPPGLINKPTASTTSSTIGNIIASQENAIPDPLQQERANAGTEESADKKAIVKRIEEEFERFKTTQLESLRLKSKVYRFIHSEIYKIDLKYSAQIKSLQAENQMLRDNIEALKMEHESYRGKVDCSISRFKAKVISSIKEYKRKHTASK